VTEGYLAPLSNMLLEFRILSLERFWNFLRLIVRQKNLKSLLGENLKFQKYKNAHLHISLFSTFEVSKIREM
jgi:hypothetical protein